jgi:uncharacterized protein (TIGR03000 family)
MVLGTAVAVAGAFLTAPALAGPGGGGHGGGGHGGGGHGGGHGGGGSWGGGSWGGGHWSGGFRTGGTAWHGGVVARRVVVVNRAPRFYPYGVYALLYGWSGYGYAGRYYPYDYYGTDLVMPYIDYYEPQVPTVPEEQRLPPPEETTPGDGAAHLLIRVPEDAELWFDGHPTQQTGRERVFVSPPLLPGRTYRYKVVARWEEDSLSVERKRTLNVRANMWASVDLTQPEPPAMPKEP